MLSILILVYQFAINQPDFPWTVNSNLENKSILTEKYYNEAWENWGRNHLKNGDIIYISGNQYVLGFNFSDYIKEISNSKYSHCGMICRFGDNIYVFDLDRGGYRKVPLSNFLSEYNDRHILIQRIDPEYEDVRICAIGYCWQQYMKNTPFDYSFRIDESKLYCAEAIINAFKSGRLLLAEPEIAGNLPGIDKHIWKTVLVIAGSYIYSERPFSLSQKLFTVQRISESKYLHTVWEGSL